MTVLSAIALATALSSLRAAPPLPTARAPFARSGAAREPVKMVVKPFSWKTNLWDGVEFISGSKRILMSGANRSIDCNNPLRFGRLFILNDRTLEAELWIKCRGLWNDPAPDDATLEIDKANNRATWRRPWRRPDGHPAVLSYSVTGRADGTALIEWDMGLSLEDALAQTNALSVSSSFTVGGRVAPTSVFGFGDTPHKLYPREKLLADGQRQIHRALPEPKTNVFNFEKRGTVRHWSLTFPGSWQRTMRVFDFAGEIRNGKEYRGVTYHYVIADFRKGNPCGYAVKGSLVFDFGESAVLETKPMPPVGGLDFWGFDAVHVPVPPTRNLIMNGSFEQGFKGWRWEDWGAVYDPVEKPNEEIAEGGFAGRHAALLRGAQYRCPSICSAPMPLVAGRKYTVSCMAKTVGKKMSFNFRVRSVSQNGKYWQFRRMNDVRTFTVESGDWKRYAFTFEADGGGFYVQMSARGSVDPVDGILVDAVQVEEGETATDFAEAPFVANLLTSAKYNDLAPGAPIDARLDVQALPGWAGGVKVSVKNGYSEMLYSKTFRLSGDAVLPLDLDPSALGKGIFVVRMDYAAKRGGDVRRWTDYARFSIQHPLANKHATAQFYANHPWYARVSRAPHYAKKFVEWGWGSTDGRRNSESMRSAIAPLAVKTLGIRNYVHPVAYERDMLAAVATNLPSGGRLEGGFNFREWKEVTPQRLEFLEAAAYRLAKECLPEDNIWTFWNEEESWARQIGFAEHFRCVEACMKGVKRAFAERGLPPPRFCESHGTSHYFNGRNYDAIDGYLKAAAAKGVKYDVVTIHPYQNIDGGTLSGKDSDLETQHLISQMKEYGYPDSTPIMFTECFNMHTVRIPPWGADGWGDSYRSNTQPSLDLGNREFLMAASQMRLYIIALKFWPKVQLVHPWNPAPILDIDFTPCAFIFSANTLGHFLPDPKFVGDAQPYGDVRGYCFRQGDKAVMPVWTTNHDVEWGVKKSPVLEIELPADTVFADMFGNKRAPSETVRGANGLKTVKVPLTPAPLFLVSRDAEGLLRALRGAVADDPSTALSADVRPSSDGSVSLVLQNETKARQKGALTAGGREIAYDVPPRGKQSFPLASGETAPMKVQAWSGEISILPRPWNVKWFFVPKCGEKPDWAAIPAQPLLTEKLGKGAQGALKAECKLAWNKDFLFVRVEAEDAGFIPAAEDGKPFVPSALYAHDGCLEVYFDGFGDARTQGTKGYDLNDSRYDFLGNDVHRFLAVNWQLAQGTASATDEEVKEKLVRKFTRTEKGYVYEIAFAARYMAPVDLKAGTVAGLGLCLHDWNRAKDGKFTHANLSNATEPGVDCDKKPYVWPLMILGD
jgi:hypothetical protein